MFTQVKTGFTTSIIKKQEKQFRMEILSTKAYNKQVKI